MSDKRSGRAPALFDDAAFAEDLRRTSNAGEEVAHAARREFERDGVSVGNLLACDEEGPDGTVLRHCLKLRLPPPDGKFGMVFRIESSPSSPRPAEGSSALSNLSQTARVSAFFDCQ